MTYSERRLAARTFLLGIILTLFVIALDSIGALLPLEHFLYDLRARTCQFFAPPPTDDLVYIDIDDQSLDAIGEFPWPRDTLAPIVDEIHRAGAKTIAFDIIFDKPQPGSDPTLAAACRKFNQALLPVTFDLGTGAASAASDMVLNVLRQDLELSAQQVIQALRDRGSAAPDLEARVQRDFPDALRDAMYDGIVAQVPDDPLPNPDRLRPILLPRTSPVITDSYLLRQLTAQCQRVSAERVFRRFAREPAPNEPELLRARRVMPPVATIGDASTATGYVDYVVSDGVVRTMPLFINYRDGLYPQAGLALACAVLNIDPKNRSQVELADDAVTLHPNGRDSIRIPTRRVQSSPTQRGGNAFMDVPWYGDPDWAAMYRRFKKNPHVLINDVWQLAQSRRALIVNNNRADEAIKPLIEVLRPDALKAYLDHPFAPEDYPVRQKLIASLFDEMRTQEGYMETYLAKNPDGFSNDTDKTMCRAINAAAEIQSRGPQLLDMIARQEKFLRSRLENRAALIGYVATAVAASDFVPTSLYPRCPGVIVHGAIANGILTGELWRTAPPWVTWLVTILVGLLTAAAASLLSPWKAAASTLTLLAAYFSANGLLLFDRMNLIVGVAAPIVAVAAVWSGCTLARLLIEGAQRLRITRRFRAYQDPGFANFIIEHPEEEEKILKGQTRELTICFTDLAGFTSLSEQLGPAIVNVIREYLTGMVPVIHRRGGHVDKFSGDGIMFFFGAPRPNPNHAADAVATILDMQLALQAYNRRLAEQNLPPVAMRAGIATGQVIAGDIGSAERSNYTVLGDDVNLAARLESANKTTGTTNLLTQSTADALKNQFLLRPVGNLQVMGKLNAVMTYEALCPLADYTDSQKQLVTLTRQMIEAFQQSRFQDCINLATQLENDIAPDKLAALYLTLSRLHQSSPAPEPFEAKIILSEK